MERRHLWQGEWVDDKTLYKYLSQGLTYESMVREPLNPEYVFDALKKLVPQLACVWEENPDAYHKELSLVEGLSPLQKDYYKDRIQDLINPDKWRLKRENDIGNLRMEDGASCRFYPYGVVLHIGAGNEVALSAFSVMEGLLAGNVNILKVPAYEGGISMMLLHELCRIEERIKPYIYVLDIPSEEFGTLLPLVELVDAAVLWGSVALIQRMRCELPPTLPLIEWGHKISFAYLSEKAFTSWQKGETETIGKTRLENLAKDMVISGQKHCSSPLTLFVESREFNALETLAQKLADIIEDVLDGELEDNPMEEGIRSLARVNRRMKVALGREKTFYGPRGYGCVRLMQHLPFDEAPFEATIVLVPINREEMLSRLAPYRRYFQTVGLEAEEEEREGLYRLFMQLGATRICPWGKMADHQLLYPHDGYLSIGKMGRFVVTEE